MLVFYRNDHMYLVWFISSEQSVLLQWIKEISGDWHYIGASQTYFTVLYLILFLPEQSCNIFNCGSFEIHDQPCRGKYSLALISNQPHSWDFVQQECN